MPSRWKVNQTIQAAKGWTWKFILIAYLAYAVVFGLSNYILSQFRDWNGLVRVLTAYFITTLVSVSFVLFVCKKSLQSLGMETRQIFPKILTGWAFAAISLITVWLFNLAFGGITVSLNPNISWLWFILLLIGFVFQGFMEEFLMRALIFTYIARKNRVILGLILNSVIFALGHLNNQNASFISVLNTFLLGVVFSLVFYYHENLWLVGGFHSSWNFILGVVLGVEVSGFEIPTFLLKTDLTPGMPLLNGGVYGFEASICVSILSLVLIGLYWWLLGKKREERAG